MSIRNLSSVLWLGLAFSSPAMAAPAAAPVHPAGDPALGRQLYESLGCYQCHGHIGQGADGPRLAPNPPELVKFAALVRSPLRNMPPYSADVLSAKEIVDIYAYLQSVPPPPPLSQMKILGEP